MTREIAYLLLATAAAAALLLVILLAWHELSGRSRAERYRTQVSAARLAVRQELRDHDRAVRRHGPTTKAGTVVLDLQIDTTVFDEQMLQIKKQIEQMPRFT